MICLGMVLFFFFFSGQGAGAILPHVPWASWICGIVLDIDLGKFSVVIVSNSSSIPFLLLIFPYSHIILFVLRSLGIVLFFSVFLLFSVLEISIAIVSSSDIFLSYVRLWIRSSKPFFIVATVLLIIRISVLFFIRMAIFLIYIAHLFLHAIHFIH